MPAIISLTQSAATPLARVLLAAGGRVAHRLKKILRALRNRRYAGQLAGLDDRMLADIGLTRSDLRDAYAEPLWHDPTDVLARRACERRSSRRRSAFDGSCDRTLSAGAAHQPSADRPARYLI